MEDTAGQTCCARARCIPTNILFRALCWNIPDTSTTKNKQSSSTRSRKEEALPNTGQDLRGIDAANRLYRGAASERLNLPLLSDPALRRRRLSSGAGPETV